MPACACAYTELQANRRACPEAARFSMDRAETSPSGEQDGESDVLSLQPKKLGLGAWTLSATGIFWIPRIRFTN